MKKKVIVAILMVMMAFSLCACSTESNVLTDSGQKQTEEALSTPQQLTKPEIPNAPMPMVKVNEVIYQSYEYGSHLAKIIDDNWTLVGEIESVSETRLPTANLQANFNVAGASVYHSSNASFTVNPYGSDFLATSNEYLGDGIILDYDGVYYQLIAADDVDEVEKMRNEMKDYGQLLLLDGVTYRMRSMASGGDFKLDDSYVYLGEVRSVVPENERPVDDFQTNSLIVGVGSNIYQLPSINTSDSDIVVICGNNRYEYKN